MCSIIANGRDFPGFNRSKFVNIPAPLRATGFAIVIRSDHPFDRRIDRCGLLDEIASESGALDDVHCWRGLRNASAVLEPHLVIVHKRICRKPAQRPNDGVLAPTGLIRYITGISRILVRIIKRRTSKAAPLRSYSIVSIWTLSSSRGPGACAPRHENARSGLSRRARGLSPTALAVDGILSACRQAFRGSSTQVRAPSPARDSVQSKEIENASDRLGRALPVVAVFGH